MAVCVTPLTALYFVSVLIAYYLGKSKLFIWITQLPLLSKLDTPGNGTFIYIIKHLWVILARSYLSIENTQKISQLSVFFFEPMVRKNVVKINQTQVY